MREESVLHVFVTLARPLIQADPLRERERDFRRVLGETVQVLLQLLTERPERLAWRPRRSPPVAFPLGFRGERSTRRSGESTCVKSCLSPEATER